MTMRTIESARPRAFCATCDGLGLVTNPVLEYPTPCSVCNGDGCVDRVPATVCYTCGTTGFEWIVGIGFIRCRKCNPPTVAIDEAPPHDWTALTIVLGCIALVAILLGACTWSALCRGWLT